MKQQLLHQRKRSKKSKSDEWWTPKEFISDAEKEHGMQFEVDVACTWKNCQCMTGLTTALKDDWNVKSFYGKRKWGDVWCNPPHSMTDDFVSRGEAQHLKHGMRIMMIVPANYGSTRIFHKYIEGKREYHFVEGRPKFLKHGLPSPSSSRNSYIVILWK